MAAALGGPALCPLVTTRGRLVARYFQCTFLLVPVRANPVCPVSCLFCVSASARQQLSPVPSIHLLSVFLVVVMRESCPKIPFLLVPVRASPVLVL